MQLNAWSVRGIQNAFIWWEWMAISWSVKKYNSGNSRGQIPWNTLAVEWWMIWRSLKNWVRLLLRTGMTAVWMMWRRRCIPGIFLNGIKSLIVCSGILGDSARAKFFGLFLFAMAFWIIQAKIYDCKKGHYRKYFSGWCWVKNETKWKLKKYFLKVEVSEGISVWIYIPK